MKPGDYVVVKVLRAAGTTMYCEPRGLTTLTEFYRVNANVATKDGLNILDKFKL